MNTSECSLPHVHKHMKRRPVYAHSKAWQRLDDKKCEALLLDWLKDHGSLTKPEIVCLL